MQLDQYQELVVRSPSDANIRVIGAPGSGKSRTLMMRYAHLYVRGVKPSRILVLTFSKKASDEIRKRISARVDLGHQAENQISTINAFCYRLYNDWRKNNGYEPLKVWKFGSKVTNPNFIASDLIQKHLMTSDLSLFDQINKTLKSHPEPLPELLDKIGIHGPRAIAAHKAWVEYEIWMKNNHLTDFYGQVWNVDRLLHTNPVIGMMIGRRFDKILADECQDMFEQTYRILLKLAEQSSIELYGDPSQSVYGFNGAAPHLFYEVDTLIPGLETHHLANNYRSRKTIVEVVNDFGPSTSERFSIMNCVKVELGKITIKSTERITDQADYIAEQIKVNNFKPDDIYVLARTNSQCSMIYQRLLELGIPANYAGNFSVWDKSHVKAGIGYLAITNEQDGPDDLTSILNIPSEDYLNVFGRNNGKYTPTRFLPKQAFQGRSFKDILNGKLKLTRAQGPGASNIRKFINKLQNLDDNRARVGDIGSAISKWAQWSGLDHLAVDDDLGMLWDKLENFDYSVDGLRNHIQILQEARRKIKPGSNKVQVMTIHQAKGLEAPVIFLTGLSEPTDLKYHTKSGFHPGRNTNELINEENCLFYTGISRAIENLYLTYYLYSGQMTYQLSGFITQFMKEKANYGNI